MTRKVTRKTHILPRNAPVVAAVIAMIVLAALAQPRATKQASGKSHVLSAKASAPPSGVTSAPFFLPAVTYGAAGTRATFVTAIDLNGDGKPELLVGDRTCALCKVGGVTVLLNDGEGSFPTGGNYGLAGLGGESIAIADMDADGGADMLVANRCGDAHNQKCLSGAVIFRTGRGDGTFAPGFFQYDSGGRYTVSIAVADLNGDGKPDVVVANECMSVTNCNSGSLGVLLGNGDATFQPVATYSSGGNRTRKVVVADVNGDGKSDLVVANECATFSDCTGSPSVLLGNGDGTFEAAVVHVSGGLFAESVAVADLNGDGKPDLVVANSCIDGGCNSGSVDVLLGNGNGTFQPPVTFASGGGGAHSIAIADMDGDSKLDIVVANRNSNTVGMLLGNGDGSFGTAATFGSGGVLASSVAVAELNGDGRADIIVTNECIINNPKCRFASVGVLMNNNGPHSPTTTALGSNVNPAAAGQLVTYTATVTNQSSGQITGTVSFQHGRAMTTMPLVDHQATYQASYSGPGTHPITATYSGDADNTSSTSATFTEYVGRAPTQTVVTTSGSPSHVGQTVTFRAKVAWTYGTVPNGELVTFFDGATAIGTGTTARGSATFGTSSLSVKTHQIKATYSGDAAFKSSFGKVVQVVQP